MAGTDLSERLRAALHQPSRGEALVRTESVTERNDLSTLGGHWFQSPMGPGYVIESLYEAGHQHGSVVLHQALSVDPAKLAGQTRDARLATVPAGSYLYIDTETTGLGGAGSMVFLAGTARFDGSLLRLRQYLLPSPGYEGGLLGGLGEDLDQAEALVSYNGKSFDLPMLESRYILSRQRPTFRQLPHLDLLHPNRRLFKGTFDSHRLTRMEVELLGFERESDCPSAEVPERYFRFQRTGDPTHILPVLRHNAWDVLSLVALAAHLASVCGGESYPLQAGRASEYAGQYADAAHHFSRVAKESRSRAERLEALEKGARCQAKLGNWEEAATLWRTLIEQPWVRKVTPYVELAKVMEHRQKDTAGAYVLTTQALDMAKRGMLKPGPQAGETCIEALEHRAARLQAKLGRATQ